MSATDHWDLVIVPEIELEREMLTLARKTFLNSTICTEIAFLVAAGTEKIGGVELPSFTFRYMKAGVEVDTTLYAD
jgi:hypothetical protein